jgi:rubrerythrin
VRVGVGGSLWERKGGLNMLSQIPIILENVKKEDMDKEILRTGIIAELDAINLYEQMAAIAKNNDIKKILLDIAKEEKTHVGEFLTLLQRKDREQEAELEEGKKEVEEFIGK